MLGSLADDRMEMKAATHMLSALQVLVKEVTSEKPFWIENV